MIILSILKVIGLILLAIIGILLLILLLVLFVPIKYSLSGYRDDEKNYIYINARFSWLFSLLRFSYIYPDKPYLRVKFLFFTIYNSAKPKKEKRKKYREDENIDEKSVINNDKDINENLNKDLNKAMNIDINNEIENEEKADKKENDILESFNDYSNEEESSKSFIDKIKHFFKNIIYTIQSFYDKIKNTKLKFEETILNINDYVEKLKSDEVKQAISLCLEQLLRILKSIRPRKIRVNLLLGLKDPATTGKILEVYSILYPYIGKYIYVKPDFEHQVISGDFLIRGKITSCTMVFVAWKLFWDKNIRKVIKMFKHTNTIREE